MSGLCLQNALLVAKDKYHEDGLKIDFMAVNALNDALVEAVGLDKNRIDGVPVIQLEESLASLLCRHQHSEEFYGMIEEGRNLIIHTVRQDRRALSDLKNWDVLSCDERIGATNYFAGIVRDIFVSHIELPPDTGLVVNSKRQTETPAIDYAAFGVVVPAKPERDVGGRYPIEISVDTDHEIFQDGFTTYATIYMDYIRLIESTLPKGNMRGKFGKTIDKIPHDIELCRAAQQEDAFIDPLLKNIGFYHFSNMLVATEGRCMLHDLEKTLVTHGQDIPVYQRPTFRDKIGMFLATKGLHL